MKKLFLVPVVLVLAILVAAWPNSTKFVSQPTCSVVGKHLHGDNGPYQYGIPYCEDTPFVNGVPIDDPRL